MGAPEVRTCDSAALAIPDPALLPRRAAARAEADVRRLLAYAARETPTGDVPALDGFLDLVADDARHERPDATCRRVPTPAGDVLVVDVPGRGRPALLLAHHDTVHPVGSLDGRVPLVRDGALLRGPGVYDMKGGLVAALAALGLLREIGSGGPDGSGGSGGPAGSDGSGGSGCGRHRAVRLLVTPDEEVGSPAAGAVVRELARDVEYALGLEPPHPDGALKTSRMGSTRWRLTVEGRAAHAALDPANGVSAIDELVDRLLDVRSLAAEHPDVLVNVGTVGGGGRTNVVPDAAHADIGLRFRDARSEDVVLGRLAGLRASRPGAVLTSAALTRRPAWEPAPATEALLARVVDAGALVGQPVTGRAATGAADTNLTGAEGVPSLDGFGLLGGGAHAVDERADLTSLPRRAALLAAVLATV